VGKTERRTRSLAAALLAVGAACSLVAQAATTKGTVIILRALAYDRGFDERVVDAVDVAILYRSAVATSKKCMTDELATQAELAHVTLKGHEIRLAAVDLDAAALETAKDSELWFVCPGLDADIAAIVADAEKRHRITASESRAYVEQGLVLGIEEGVSETTLYVNLPASKRVGAEFNSQLLGVATVIR
jgi:hypothetical protein